MKTEKKNTKKSQSLKKIKPPAKNKQIGHPKKNSGYAEEQPSTLPKEK